MNLSDNEVAQDVIKYFLDLMASDVMPSRANPAAGWAGATIPNKQLAIAQYGYWFNGVLRPKEELEFGEKVLYATAPRWAGTGRRNPCAAGTNGVISSQTEYPDQTWKFFEWAYGMEPAKVRAASGWGIPALKSMYALMPNETAYDQQVQKVLTADMAASDFVLKYNPFYDAQSLNSGIWPGIAEAYVQEEMGFDEAIKELEQQNNKAIKDGISRLG